MEMRNTDHTADSCRLIGKHPKTVDAWYQTSKSLHWPFDIPLAISQTQRVFRPNPETDKAFCSPNTASIDHLTINRTVQVSSTKLQLEHLL